MLDLIRKFVDERLGGEIAKWKDYDCRELEHSDVFGCPGRNFDCDDSNLIRAVYLLLWGDSFPGCSTSAIGRGKPYRGDTMNTFHTLFGRPIEDKPGFYAGLEKYAPDDELRERAGKFHTHCHTIGNYILLPNLPEGRLTLNLYRGTNDWKDFFDRFLIQLGLCLQNKPGRDEFLAKLIGNNRFFFDKISLPELAGRCFLEDYMDENGTPKEVFLLNFHWKDENDREAYRKAADRYLDRATGIINRRAEKMIAILEKLL